MLSIRSYGACNSFCVASCSKHWTWTGHPSVFRISSPCLSSSHIYMSTYAQVWNDSDEPDECLAMVVRTGLNAAVGKMLLCLFYRQRRWKGMRSPMGFLLKVLGLAPLGPCPSIVNMRSKALSYFVSYFQSLVTLVLSGMLRFDAVILHGDICTHASFTCSRSSAGQSSPAMPSPCNVMQSIIKAHFRITVL